VSFAVAAEPLDREWDVFISYAREDSDWVKEHLYEPLLTCKTAAATRPVVFLDVAKEGIPSGRNFYDFIAEAMQRSRHIVPVYSATYFQKPMCDYELKLALGLHVQGRGQLHPVLLEEAATAHIPYTVSQINWYPAEWPDWFERLCDDLQLTVERTPPSLRFRSDVEEITERHTLPPVEVAVVDPQSAAVLSSAEALTIRAVGAEVQGTLVVESEGGIASFRDLSFASAAPEVRLVAEAPGCEPAVSAAFRVKPAAPVALDGQPRRIAARGLPVFFPDGQTLAVAGDGRVAAFAADGSSLAEAPLPGRVRAWARGETAIAVADWSGHVVLLGEDGGVRSFDLRTDDHALSVPGALSFAGDRVDVGMWNGTVWALSLDEPEPQRLLEHPAGVQALAAAGDRRLVGGLDGSLTVYSSGGTAERHSLEPLLLALRAWPDCAVAVGEQKVHRLSLRARNVLHQELPLGETSGALLDGELGVAVDGEGRGVRFDSELNIRAGFHVARGARPVAVDRTGSAVAFAYADGSYVLMVDDRVVFSSSSGALTISPDGLRVALDDGGAIRVASLADLGADST
jgi:hypothetical protein